MTTDPRITLSGDSAQITAYTCAVPLSRLHKRPDPLAPIDDQLLYGHGFNVTKIEGDWAHGQCVSPDGSLGYVGWLRAADVRIGTPKPTHYVTHIRAPIFTGNSLKLPSYVSLSFGSQIAADHMDGDYAYIADLGYIHKRHITAFDTWKAAPRNPIALARLFLGLPYLWGGKGADGLDCSGLVQMTLWMSGKPCSRDADQQELLGEPVDIKPDLSGLKAGDLIFWKGHVGMMVDASVMIHANGFHMTCCEEPLALAAARIAKTDGPITSIRRWI